MHGKEIEFCHLKAGWDELMLCYILVMPKILIDNNLEITEFRILEYLFIYSQNIIMNISSS